MNSCSCCQKPVEFTPIGAASCIHTDEEFEIGECPNCTYQKVLNPPDDLRPYYKDGPMKQPLNSIHKNLKKLLLKREFDLIRNYTNESKGPYIDLGCGVGDFSYYINSLGYEVIAIDADSEKPVEIKNIDDISYLQIDYSNYHIPNSEKLKGGTVILRHVLEHVSDPYQFIQKLISYGIEYFYIVVPNHKCFASSLFGKNYYFLDPPLHLSFFSEESLRSLMACSGLTVEILKKGTIPNIFSSIYRYLKTKNRESRFAEIFKPQSILNSLSAPLDLLAPNNILINLSKKS